MDYRKAFSALEKTSDGRQGLVGQQGNEGMNLAILLMETISWGVYRGHSLISWDREWEVE